MVAVGLATAGTLADPSDLVLDRVPGFERTSVPATDLTFAEYADRQPDAVAHLDPASAEAAGISVAIEVWSDAAEDEELVVQIVRAGDEQVATTFVDQAAANSIAVGLAATDPPFGGAWSYAGPSDDHWTKLIAWTQGPYAIMLIQHSPEDDDRAVIDGAAMRQAEIILEETGAEVSEEAAVADDAPPPPSDATLPDEPEADEGGNAAGALIVAIAVVAGAAIALGLRRFARRPATD